MRHPVSKPVVSPVPLGVLAALMAKREPSPWYARLSQLLPNGLGRAHRWLLILLAFALLLTAFAHPAERAIGSWIANRAPGSWVYAGSIQTLQRLDEAALSPSRLPDALQMQIRSQFAALRMPSGDAPLYELVFRKSNQLGAISFALAGGQIIVTDEFVARFGSERELLTALTMQLGHLQHRHALRAITDRAPLKMALNLLSDDASSGVQLISEAQPILEHDAHALNEAQSFAEAVMRTNPAKGSHTS
jgi:Zn-dependent protease with chaperone function